MTQEKTAKLKLISSMVLFGTIGLFVRYLQLPSSVIALGRAVIGTVFLAAVVFLKGERINWLPIRKNLFWLILSGIFLGFNWIMLFESYRYTTVAVSTVCYYMAPIIVVAVSPLLLKEKLSVKKGTCVAAALAGIILISGFTEGSSLSGTAGKGIAFGLIAAVLYACVIISNKRIAGIGAFDKTIFQLLISAITLLPYCILTEGKEAFCVGFTELILLALVGIIHTGITYLLYFGSMEHVSGQSVAVISYIDPLVAVVLSVFILGESLTPAEWIGVALILCAAFFSEFEWQRK